MRKNESGGNYGIRGYHSGAVVFILRKMGDDLTKVERMNEPWTSYKFDYLERERINEIEEWMLEHEDEIAYRIVYLETQLEIEAVHRRIRNKAACINCKKYRYCGIGEEMRHSERESEFNCCDWVGGS